MNYKELLEAMTKAHILVGIVIDEMRKTEWAMFAHDKLGHKEIVKALRHMYFDLRQMDEGLERLTRKESSTVATYEDWFYPDQSSIDEVEAHDRLVRLYGMAQRLYSLMREILETLDSYGAKEEYLACLNAHLFLALHFLRFDIRTVAGIEL